MAVLGCSSRLRRAMQSAITGQRPSQRPAGRDRLKIGIRWPLGALLAAAHSGDDFAGRRPPLWRLVGSYGRPQCQAEPALPGGPPTAPRGPGGRRQSGRGAQRLRQVPPDAALLLFRIGSRAGGGGGGGGVVVEDDDDGRGLAGLLLGPAQQLVAIRCPAGSPAADTRVTAGLQLGLRRPHRATRATAAAAAAAGVGGGGGI